MPRWRPELFDYAAWLLAVVLIAAVATVLHAPQGDQLLALAAVTAVARPFNSPRKGPTT